jgi:hypothetical protein
MRFPPSGCKEPCRKCHGAALTPGRSKVACCDGVPKCASVCVRWQRGRERDGRRAGLSLACSHQILGGWTGETVWHRRGDFASLAAAVPLPLSACLPACACMCVRACCSTYSSLLSPKLRSRSPSLHAIPLPHSTHPTLLLLTHPLITPSLSLHTLGLAITRPKFTADVHLFIFLFTSIAIAILFRPLTKRTLRSSAPAVSKRPPGRLQQTCRANPRFSINKISVS